MSGVREIVLDTETTGLDVANGDKLVEIGCVEVVDKVITGDTLHFYINPERELSREAEEITGLNYNMLKKYPLFKDVAQEFLDYIGESRLVIHNASFDVGFLNFELKASGFDYEIKYDRVVDTLFQARRKFPGAAVSLDALCKRYKIDKSSRIKHGALIDADLLAKVYIILSVETRQNSLLGDSSIKIDDSVNIEYDLIDRNLCQITQEEEELHNKFLQEKIKNAIWLKL